MPTLSHEVLERDLESLSGGPVHVHGFAPLGVEPASRELKAFGYGAPLLVEYEMGGARRRAVLETQTPSPYGHEHMADRAQGFLWDHQAFNRMPRHVRALDVGAFGSDGSLLSLGRADEFFPWNILFRRFWDRYLNATQDREMLEVAARFFAFRGLVMAGPIWYPRLAEGVRRKIFSFTERVLEASRFDPGRVNEYCG